MFEFLIDDLEGKTLVGDLENIGACYPDDDVIYMFGIPCRLSSARPTQAAPDAAKSRRQNVVCPECETLFAVELSPNAAQVS